jgi:predicted  nucleic acid-binding Zn-ribbon protein
MYKMVRQISLLTLTVLCLCGCQSSDPYVRTEEFVTRSEQIAQAETNAAMATLDRRFSANVDELSAMIASNAESISSLKSDLGSLEKRRVEALSQLKADIKADTSRDTHAIEQNAKAISALESDFNSFVTENTKLVTQLGSNLDGFQEKVSEFHRDIEQDLSEQETAWSEKADQLSEKINQLRNKTNEALASLSEKLQARSLPVSAPTSSMPSRSQQKLTDAKETKGKKGDNRYLALAQPLDDEQRSLYQLSAVAAALLILAAGPLIAELYARQAKRRANTLAMKWGFSI